MSDTVIIALIIAVVILAALIIFRKQLSRFVFKAGKDGVEAELETHKPGSAARPAAQPASPATVNRPGVVVSGNKQTGVGNVIDVSQADATVKDNEQKGQNQKLRVRPEAASPKRKP
jgi:predicted lipid-binding transport protein (Tim44 family)